MPIDTQFELTGGWHGRRGEQLNDAGIGLYGRKDIVEYQLVRGWNHHHLCGQQQFLRPILRPAGIHEVEWPQWKFVVSKRSKCPIGKAPITNAAVPETASGAPPIQPAIATAADSQAAAIQSRVISIVVAVPI
ncbi:hypothetical protein G7077_01805 [Sphingomonas piscis]|uniref:Uncharacterized protein n=1 Tax=Sphingomonas piscis TaxID=2714943 RepID=A0A6G7YM61_9SPHN|nr:hypothetical protein [Sphingomonas piscis]QIK77835.1 hypothetical protein G7077_01805 [Sphingomonas piscis]